jgi:hypothetical protein
MQCSEKIRTKREILSRDDLLNEELELFRKEKENVRELVGRIGGKQNSKKDRILTFSFLIIVALLFLFNLIRHVFHFDISGFSALLSIEIAILLVSLKVIWMIHTQTKVEHFQFWILTRTHHKYSTAATNTPESTSLFSHIRPRRTVQVRLRSLHSKASYSLPSTPLRYEYL